MYRLANATSYQTVRELGDLMSTDAPLAEHETDNSNTAGIRNVSNDDADTIDTESERRRLLQKLQTSSMKHFRASMAISDEDEGIDNKSTYSTKAVRVWWRRARQNIGKASRKSKKQFKQKLQNFSWKTKSQATYDNTEYNEMPQTRLETFFEMDSKSTSSDLRGGKRKTSIFNFTTADYDGNNETKSVASRQSLPLVLRPVFTTKKKQRDRKVDRAESFTDEFSEEVQHANRKARPTLTRQGSSFIRRLLGSKVESVPVLHTGGAFSAPTPSCTFPVRLTPTTTDTTTSDNEEDEYPNDAQCAADEEPNEERFEEEPLNAGYYSDEDEEIAQLFRPIEGLPDESVDPLPDRWSPSPSPSLEPAMAPRLPVRRPMPDEELDAPPKLVVSRPIQQKNKPITRKDSETIYPTPSPIRVKPKKSWSGESSIRSFLCGIVSSWSEGSSKSASSADEPTSSPTMAIPTKGILKRSSSLLSSTHLQKPPRSVSFDSIFVREYERVLGDNPACSNGPPISIGWQYKSKGSIPVDWYEYSKPVGRTKRQLYLPAYRRRDMLLHEWNFEKAELREARRLTKYIQNLRSQSVYEVSKRTSMTRKPTIDDSDTSQPSLRRETAERVTRYSPTPEMIPRSMQATQSRS